MNKSLSLTPQEQNIILQAGTEPPFKGKFQNEIVNGSFLCRLCGLALFRATSHFTSGCGWPSFDESIEKNVLQRLDKDQKRTEIVCSRCHAHLGHVFLGEGFTEKNTRYCVNSASLDFTTNISVQDTKEGIFAGGCFWGMEYYFQQLPGVCTVISGYTGGVLKKPDYHAVCAKNTGHYEAVRVIFDKEKLTYRDICQYFFEIHDFTQKDGQGPDIGPQYESAIFVYNDEQKQTAFDLLTRLSAKGFSPATKVLSAAIFWPAEEYHQNYYAKSHKTPYCHKYKKIF